MAHVSGPHRLGRELKEDALGRSGPLGGCDRWAQGSALPSVAGLELQPCPGCRRRHSFEMARGIALSPKLGSPV